jgi:phosphoglycerate dehydrogenase-like enzyme
MIQIVVTYDPEEKEREILNGVLGSIARIVFLSDVKPDERAKKLAAADVLISWFPSDELRPEEFGLITRARMMQLLSAGADHVPFSRFPNSLMIASNSGAYAEPMAEHILAMILASTKHLIDRHSKLRSGQFDQHNPNRMLRGLTCAILGFGGIGRATSQLLRCFGVRIYAINTTGKTSEAVEFVGTLKDLKYVLRLADIVIVTIPLTVSTRGLIGKRQLEWMKDDAIIINVARGDIIDEASLYEKLKSHPNFMAGIDAWWVEPHKHGQFRMNYPFLELPNVLGSPHNSSIVPGTMPNATRRLAENVRRFLEGDPILGVVRDRLPLE